MNLVTGLILTMTTGCLIIIMNGRILATIREIAVEYTGCVEFLIIRLHETTVSPPDG